MSYRQVLNSLALQQLNKQMQIPDYRCGVGNGELLEPMRFSLQYHTAQKSVVVAKPLSIEDVSIDQQGKLLLDFPQEGWLGNTIGGF